MSNIILMYHSIGSQNNGEVGNELYSVPEDTFREQMEYLSVHGPRSTVHGSEIIITFDDGDITNYTHAYPILKELGLTAHFFILVSKVGTNGYMNWKQIRELRDAGMIIGSHGMMHRILTKLDDRELDYELRLSKKALEESLGHSVDYMSIPRGFYDQRVVDKARQFGYKAIFTSNISDDDGFKFGRIPVKTGWDLTYFEKVVKHGSPVKSNAVEWMKASAVRVLGAQRYDRIRSRILTRNTQYTIRNTGD